MAKVYRWLTPLLACVFSAAAHAQISSGTSAGFFTSHPGAVTFQDYDGTVDLTVGAAVGGNPLCPVGPSCGAGIGSGNYAGMSIAPIDNVVVTLVGLKSYFGFFWGTNDSYNSVSFFNDTVDPLTAIATFTGAGPQTSIFNNFLAASGSEFNRVVFSSAGCCFEIDNLASTPAVAAIPEPSTYALMIAGLGVVGFVARRRQKRA